MCLGERPSGENLGARNSTLGLADKGLGSTSLFDCKSYLTLFAIHSYIYTMKFSPTFYQRQVASDIVFSRNSLRCPVFFN